ncbi:MAG: tripartite tricarboxylate transporter substrate binding protein [Pigmentiphaga sp.]|nr:tripartite tricarboxylate transporter substrate binding protein [Pigmentiphaga sp.]
MNPISELKAVARPWRKALLASGMAAVLSLAAPLAHAWPNGPVTMIVPSSPGSAPDVLARKLSEKLGSTLKVPVMVENRPGANGVIGASAIATAKPDGQTIMLYDRLVMIVNPILLDKLPYDPAALQGVADVAGVNLVFVCGAKQPFNTWEEMIAAARAKPGELSVGTGGRGSVHHLSVARVEQHYGVDMIDVPYKGMAPATVALLGGEIDCIVSGQETVIDHVRAGTLKVLAIGAEERSKLLPEVPTLKELGAPADLLVPTSFVIYVPTGTPAPVMDEIHKAMSDALEDDAIVEYFASRGLSAAVSSREAVKETAERDAAGIGKLIKDANIRLE